MNDQTREVFLTITKLCTVAIQVIGVILAAYAQANQIQVNSNPSAYSTTSVTTHVSYPRTIALGVLVLSTFVGVPLLIHSIVKGDKKTSHVVIPPAIAGDDPWLVDREASKAKIMARADAVAQQAKTNALAQCAGIDKVPEWPGAKA